MGNVECDCAPGSHRTGPEACVTDRDFSTTDVWKTKPINYEANKNEKTKRSTPFDGAASKGCSHARTGHCTCPHDERSIRHW